MSAWSGPGQRVPPPRQRPPVSGRRSCSSMRDMRRAPPWNWSRVGSGRPWPTRSARPIAGRGHGLHRHGVPVGSRLAQPAILDPWGGGWIVDRARFDSLLRENAVRRGAALHTARVAGVRRVGAGAGVEVRLGDGGVVGREGCPGDRPTGPGGTWSDGASPDRRAHRDAAGGRSRRSRSRAAGRPGASWLVVCNGLRRGHHGGLLHGWRSCRHRRGRGPPDLGGTHVPSPSGYPRRSAARSPGCDRGRSATPGPPSDATLRLVGDAALAVDPLSGHGVALAVEAGVRWSDHGLFGLAPRDGREP